MNTMMSNYIQHYGVKGMKWGVRKRPVSTSTSGRSSNPVKKRKMGFLSKIKRTKTKKSLAKQKTSPEKKSLKKMSDDELNSAIKRLEMEKKYKDLKRAEVSVGKKMASNIMQKSVENIGTQLVTYALGTAVNKAIKSEVVNPKKGQRDKK